VELCGGLSSNLLLARAALKGLARMTNSTATGNFIGAVEETTRIAQMFMSMLGAARLPMLVTDPKLSENPIVFVNAAFTTLTGYDAKEVLGRNCRFLQGPETDSTSVATLRAAVEAQQDVSIQLLNYRKDGSSFWNALHVSPVYGADGELIHFFACQLDVSSWRAAENAMAKAHRLRTMSQLFLEKSTDEQSSAGLAIAAVRRWREMAQFASDAESNLARREIALAGSRASTSFEVDRLLVNQLRDAATRARVEAFDMLNKMGSHNL
jgi:PAS domain S-box-containing protein